MSVYENEVLGMVKTTNLTDYEMQLLLHKKGIKLYDEELDNSVDNETLCKHAISNGYRWDDKKELWVRKTLFSNIFNKK